MPTNVTVYSLGKERGVSKLGYIINLYKYLRLIRGSYDKVFVHMNQEYVLLAGLYWRLTNISVYLWRNHPNGSILTRLAVLLSTKVFCTSTESFTARFQKTIIMPVGVDLNIFKKIDKITPKKYSVCMVGRLSPVKHVELGLSAVKELLNSGKQVSLTIAGSSGVKDFDYYNVLKRQVIEQNLSSSVSFVSAVSQDKLPEIYGSHEIHLNLTGSGSFDKTIVEASACGATPLVSNTSLKSLLPEVCLTEASTKAIALSVERLLDPHKRLEIQDELKTFVASQSLDALMNKLFLEI